MSTDSQQTHFREVAIPKTKPIATLLNDKEALKECKCSYHIRLSLWKEDIERLNAASEKFYIYAIMSSNTYEDKVQIEIPGWKRIRKVVNDHGFSADLYVSDDEKNLVIAFRGTDDVKDWIYGNADFDINGQYGDADVLFHEVLSQYPGKRILTTGHSLGGGLAMHISLLNKGVDAVVFNPSPRVFAHKKYDSYDNSISVIDETGEVLEIVRKLFATMKKIKYEEYRYNFLGGFSIKEHAIEAFSRCMYASLHQKESHYTELCKKNTL